MSVMKLTAFVRKEAGKGPARRLRMAGRIPAVLYGKSIEPRNLSLDRNELIKTLHRRSGDEREVELTIVDGDREESLRVRLQAIQQDPVTYVPLHVDFLAMETEAAGADA